MHSGENGSRARADPSSAPDESRLLSSPSAEAGSMGGRSFGGVLCQCRVTMITAVIMTTMITALADAHLRCIAGYPFRSRFSVRQTQSFQRQEPTAYPRNLGRSLLHKAGRRWVSNVLPGSPCWRPQPSNFFPEHFPGAGTESLKPKPNSTEFPGALHAQPQAAATIFNGTSTACRSTARTQQNS